MKKFVFILSVSFIHLHQVMAQTSPDSVAAVILHLDSSFWNAYSNCDTNVLWQGHSSIIDECAAEMPEPDKIVVAVGGGGLLSGIFEGMKRNGWNGATVVTAETEGAASFLKSWTQKKITELDAIKTIAGSLAAKKVCLNAIETAKDFNVTPFIVPDAETIKACGNFLNEYNVLVEPACGAALAYSYYACDQVNFDEQVLIITCGGICMDIKQYMDYMNCYQ